MLLALGLSQSARVDLAVVVSYAIETIFKNTLKLPEWTK
jgi:hypothetical protein